MAKKTTSTVTPVDEWAASLRDSTVEDTPIDKPKAHKAARTKLTVEALSKALGLPARHVAHKLSKAGISL
jgi:hypothetical protein